MSDTSSLYCVEWEETERGWGVHPDGFSIHNSAEDAIRFIKEFQDKQPDETPDIYSRPSNPVKPYYLFRIADSKVTKEMIEQLNEGGKCGLWIVGKGIGPIPRKPNPISKKPQL